MPPRPTATALASRRNRPSRNHWPLPRAFRSESPAWAACLAAFERELTPQQFATWIRPLACATDVGRLRLTAPNRFVLQWVKDRFGGRIETLARQATGESLAVEFAVAEAGARGEACRTDACEPAAPARARAWSPRRPRTAPHPPRTAEPR